MDSSFFGLFGRSITDADCARKESSETGYNLCGTCYQVFGGGYRGHLWSYNGGGFTVTRFDVAFTEDCTISADLPGCILIACFNQRRKTENAERRIICCCGNAESERRSEVAFAKGSSVTGTEITLTEHFCTKCVNGGFCRRFMSEAFINEETLREHHELTRIFDQLNACEYPSSAARIYFESKALEALAVLFAACEASVFEETAYADSDADDGFTLKVKRYIDENSGSELTVEHLAKIACMSPGKLKYSFKRSFGRNIFEYLTEIRMEKAKRLLTETYLTIGIIAAEVGYKKSGAFAAAFRKYAGILPKEYRNAKRAQFTGV